MNHDAVQAPPEAPSRLCPPWAPGTSGNPAGTNGRNREIEHAIRRATRGGAELVEFFLALKRGKLIDEHGNVIRKLTPKEQVRYMPKAAELLLQRGFGRAPLVIESNTSQLEEVRITYQELVSDLPAERRVALS